MTSMQHLRAILQRLDCALCDKRVPRDVRDAVAATEGELIRILDGTLDSVIDALNRAEYWQNRCEAAEKANDALQKLIASDHELIESLREQVANLKEMTELLRRLPLAMAHGRSVN